MNWKIVCCSLLMLILIGLMACATHTASVVEVEEEASLPADSLSDSETMDLPGGLSASIPQSLQSQLALAAPEENSSCLFAAVVKEIGQPQPAVCTDAVFSLHRLTQAQYEHYLCLNTDALHFFARDDLHYYGCAAHSAPFGSAVLTASQQQVLLEMQTALEEDFAHRNQLAAYDGQGFYRQPFTYDGTHQYALYIPPPTEGNETSPTYLLVLSQPVRQGKGGIWCVERAYDSNGSIYHIFPSGYLNTEQSAAEYYVEQQARADAAGILPSWEDAVNQVLSSGCFGGPPTDESTITLLAEPPEGFAITANRETDVFSGAKGGDTPFRV